MEPVRAVDWIGGLSGHAGIIDQTLLPGELRILRISDPEAMRDAIRRLAVRGAPAIGVAAAFGAVLGIRSSTAGNPPECLAGLAAVCARLRSARPTAVNLGWALDRMERRARALAASGAPVPAIVSGLLDEARSILDEDRAVCRRLGEVGAALVQDGDRLLTHCNAGALATAGSGTALAVMFEAQAAHKRFTVVADETRPLLQGARLTAWELQRAGIDVTLICDGAAAHVMREGRVTKVFVGADRIARNGDAANKIGTYGVAVLAREHGIPFYVVAPASTFDLSLAGGAGIPIEERDPEEVTHIHGRAVAPAGVKVYAPAFDVTPARLITGIVTERGLVSPVNEDTVVRTVGRGE